MYFIKHRKWTMLFRRDMARQKKNSEKMLPNNTNKAHFIRIRIMSTVFHFNPCSVAVVVVTQTDINKRLTKANWTTSINM